MHGALTPRDARPVAGSTVPILSWDGRTPTSLIGHVETSLAAGVRFVVLATMSPLGRVADRGFLEGWWRAVQPRLAGMCGGWAAVVPDADANPGQRGDFAFVDFPVRFCAARAEALWWLQGQRAQADQIHALRRFQ